MRSYPLFLGHTVFIWEIHSIIHNIVWGGITLTGIAYNLIESTNYYVHFIVQMYIFSIKKRPMN